MLCEIHVRVLDVIMVPWLLPSALVAMPTALAWNTASTPIRLQRSRWFMSSPQSSEWMDEGQDANTWGDSETSDWKDVLERKEDGSFWTSFEPSAEGEENINGLDNSTGTGEKDLDGDVDAESWLDTLASLSAAEVEYNLEDANRADMARQMEEWGFDGDTISNTLGIATDDALERVDEVEGMQDYREESYWDDDVDMETVESHTMVEKDKETGEPIRAQMVYVDEHTCIGCTNCATIAQSTFFMEQEHGRARVFQQWGDDDETIEIAIETCPVDCIHYVPYKELVSLEVDRRDMSINHKSRLVTSADYGTANGFTAPQQISGNMGSRCNNCPSRGCRDCPMFGVGKNPEYEKRERLRKERIAKKRMDQQREMQKKRVDL